MNWFKLPEIPHIYFFRFASGENLETKPLDNFLDVITDEISQHECCSDPWKTSSTSCPCIENLANSAATLAQSQLSMDLEKSSKPSYNSVPTLCYRLSLPPYPQIHALSAPTSPRKQELCLGKFPECEEVLHWADCTPLLKITKPPRDSQCFKLKATS